MKRLLRFVGKTLFLGWLYRLLHPNGKESYYE